MPALGQRSVWHFSSCSSVNGSNPMPETLSVIRASCGERIPDGSVAVVTVAVPETGWRIRSKSPTAQVNTLAPGVVHSGRDESGGERGHPHEGREPGDRRDA